MWRRSWHRLALGLEAPSDGSAWRDAVLARYAEPHRRYHTQQHLHECLSQLEPVLGLAEQPSVVEAALWFHDAIYELQAHDNEAQSAAWAVTVLTNWGVAAPTTARVAELVLATQHAQPPTTPDAQLLVDVDLAILAAPPSRFDEYDAQIRAEYAWVPAVLYFSKRRAVLAGFLERSRIFSTPHFHALLEQQARSNLCRALARSAPLR